MYIFVRDIRWLNFRDVHVIMVQWGHHPIEKASWKDKSDIMVITF